MGCFLGCFGSSKNRKRRNHKHRKVLPRDQTCAGNNPVQSTDSLVGNCLESLNSTVSENREKPEEQSSLSNRKKVTFDSNVRTYEHVPQEEEEEISPEGEGYGVKEENIAKPRHSQSCSDENSVMSSCGSHPANHRYQNCRDSDDELDSEGSDIDDEEDGDLEDDYDDGIVQSRCRIAADMVVTEEIDESVLSNDIPERDVKQNQNARNRGGYVHSVLNPVENISQWQAVKAKASPGVKQQKENLTALAQEPRTSSTSELGFKETSFSFKSNSDRPKKLNQEPSVDASLSNWLSSPNCSSISKTSTPSVNAYTPDKSISPMSHSPRSYDDRPILGALTVEELKQISVTRSPRKSPSRSPEDMPIVGIVGSYWNNSRSDKDSGSATSYKGIPNTTSKYREDKVVNWHSTPFETRLERALNTSAARAVSSPASNAC